MEDYTERYIAELDDITEKIGKKCKDPRQMAIAYMEYIRLACMYENLDKDNEIQNGTWNSLFSGLSCSPLNVAILGKGVCASQACFLSNLLISSGIEAWHSKVDVNGDNHEIVGAEIDGRKTFLDPTWYNGTIESFNGSYSKINEEMIHKPMDNITQEEIDEGSKIAKDYLIERYGIREISEQLKINDSTSDLEKHLKILAFCNTHLTPVPENAQLKFRSVMLDDREIERGKLMELFYTANDIPYKTITLSYKYEDDSHPITSFTNKEDVGLLVKIDDDEKVIIPNHCWFKGKKKDKYGEDFCYDNVEIQTSCEEKSVYLIKKPESFTFNKTVLSSGDERTYFIKVDNSKISEEKINEIIESAKKVELENEKGNTGAVESMEYPFITSKDFDTYVLEEEKTELENKETKRGTKGENKKETKREISRETSREKKREISGETKRETSRNEYQRATKEKPRVGTLEDFNTQEFKEGQSEWEKKFIDEYIETDTETEEKSELDEEVATEKLSVKEKDSNIQENEFILSEPLEVMHIEDEAYLSETIIAEIESDQAACKEYEARLENERNEDGRER